MALQKPSGAGHVIKASNAAIRPVWQRLKVAMVGCKLSWIQAFLEIVHHFEQAGGCWTSLLMPTLPPVSSPSSKPSK